MATPPRSRVLPAGNLVVGYCNWNQCGDDSIVRAVQDGVNVVIWFAINLDYDPVTGLPHITNGPDWACVADTVQKINALGLATTHLIRCRRKLLYTASLLFALVLTLSPMPMPWRSVGGWNSPHPDTTLFPDEYFAHWHQWNTQTVADPAKGRQTHWLPPAARETSRHACDRPQSRVSRFRRPRLGRGRERRRRLAAQHVHAAVPALDGPLQPASQASRLRRRHGPRWYHGPTSPHDLHRRPR